MNGESMTDEQFEALFREMLTRDSEEEFRRLQREWNSQGIPNKRLFGILLTIWRSMNVDDHDRELDLLSNWLEYTEL